MRLALTLVLQTLGWMVLFSVALLLVVVSTSAGMRLLGSIANRYTSHMENPVEIKNLGGTLWRGPTLQGLALYDKNGLWLELEDIGVTWRLLDGVRGRPFITGVNLRRGRLERLPEYPDALEDDEHDEAAFDPQRILPFLPQDVRVREFSISPALTGQPHVLTADITNTGTPWGYNLKAGSVQGISTTLEGTLVANPKNPSANMRFHEAPGGFVASLAKVPPRDSISLTVIAETLDGTTLLEQATLQVGASRVESQGRYVHDSGDVAATLSATVPSLRQWQALTSSTLDGRLTLGVDVSGTWPQMITSSTLSFTHGPRNARIMFGGDVDALTPSVSGTLTGVLVDGRARYPLEAHINAASDAATVRGLSLAGPGVAIIGDGEWAPENAHAALRVDVPRVAVLANFFMPGLDGSLKLNADATLRDSVAHADVSVDALRLVYQNRRVALRNPARLVIDDETLNLSRMILEIGGGTVEAMAKVSPTLLDALVTVRNVQPETLLEDDTLTGRVNGTLRATGTPAAPLFALQADLRGESAQLPVRADITASWRGNILNGRGTVVFNDVPLQADGSLDARLSLYPFKTTLGENTPLRARVQGAIDLGQFNPYLWATRQTVSGRANLDGRVAGTLGEPLIEGTLQLADASYRHTPSGLCLNGINASVRGGLNRVVLQSLTATAPEGGSLTGQGWLDLKSEKALSAQLNLNNLHLFCGGMLTGEINGSLNAGGTLEDNRVAGKLTLGPLNIQIPGNDGTTNIPRVETVRAGTKIESSRGSRTRLNVTIDAPQQIYVRGRGLDAEFGGALAVRGNANSPNINGALNVIRGNFALFGRTLALGTETSIRFAGPIPPSPFLDVHATTRADDTAITIALTGPAQTPEIKLTSDPFLPQDEVLAMLLFGKRLQTISPFQAVQLAQAARTLSGADGGEAGLIDQARQRLGLDTLDIGSDSDNNVTVTTGKYITDDVYLSLKQGATPEDRQIRTELELTPALSGYTQVDGVGVQTFGLNWKRDY